MNYVVGALLCGAVAVSGWLLGLQFELVGGPVCAILIGMIIRSILPQSVLDKARPVSAFCSKYVLQTAVVLLGFSLNLAQIVQVGTLSIPIILSTIATALIVAFILARVLNIPRKIATLVGVGSSICGGSAIAATAPVISADDEEIAQAISVIFLFNILAALIFPTLGAFLGLSESGFGVFAGTAVNDTSSVTAAATVWDGMHTGHHTLDIATVVKLTRTLAIIPITLTLSLWTTRTQSTDDTQAAKTSLLKRITKLVPLFIVLFVVASAITTFVNIPHDVLTWCKTLSKFFIVVAMGAIGLNTDIVKLVKTGGKPILLGACCWVGITIVSLSMQWVLHLW